jgi:sialidase-1
MPFNLPIISRLLLLSVSFASSQLVDVFISGQEGYECYRIPAIVIHPVTGELIAFAEARKYNCDDHGWVDLVQKRSTDGGRSWTQLSLIRSESSKSQNVTIGNPAPIVAHDVDGSILLFLPFCRNNIGNVGLLKSNDFGKTFNLVTNISIPTSWTWIATGPPAGLQIGGNGGRLLIPINEISHGVPDKSLALISDDLGLNWDMSSNSISEANECQISTLPWLSPNTLFLSMRSANGTSRYGSISTDSGSTWGNAFETIKETQCEASTISLPATGKIVMSSAFAMSRTDMTLHVSTDSGRSWSVYKQLYSGSSAYSALIDMNQTLGTSVGCLFERDGYSKISFVVTILA